MGRKIVKQPRGLGNTVKYHEIVGGIEGYRELKEYFDSVDAEFIDQGPCEGDTDGEYECLLYESPKWEDAPAGVGYEVITIERERDRQKIEANKLKETTWESWKKNPK